MEEPKDGLVMNMDESSPRIKELDDNQLIQYLTEYFRGIHKDGTKIIALIGGPASGKGTLAAKIAKSLGKTTVLSSDNYLKGDRVWRRANIEGEGLDPILKYDPEFLNEQIQAIKDLQDGQELGIPIYDGMSGIAISKDPNNRPDNSVYPTKVKGHQDFVIIEGDFRFLDPQQLDRLVYLDVDDQTRLENRTYRDTVDRGESDKEKIKENFESRQQTQFIPHTLPQIGKADLVIKVHAELLGTPTPVTKFAYSYDLIPQTHIAD